MSKSAIELTSNATQLARAKFGITDYPDGTAPTALRVARAVSARGQTEYDRAAGVLSWLTILREEIVEVACAENLAELRIELAQVASVALEWSDAIARRQAGGAADDLCDPLPPRTCANDNPACESCQ